MLTKNQRGFTITELLLVLALICLVLAIGWNAFNVGQKAWQSLQTKLEAEAAVRYTSQLITHELTNASFLEIRTADNNWTSTDVVTGDRIIYSNTNGNIILQVVTSTGTTDTTMTNLERCKLVLSFSKRLNINDSNTPHHPIPNALVFTITATDNDGNNVYSSTSSIMLSNMRRGTGVPVSEVSLYSTPDESNYIPGDRIRYSSVITRYTPDIPDFDYSCGGL